MPRPDRHNEIEINLLRSGSLTYLLGGRKIRIPACHLSLFWAAIPHQIVEFEDTTEYLVATLPLSWFLQCKLPKGMVQALLQGGVLSESRADQGIADLALLSRWEQDLDNPCGELKKAVLLEMEARLLRLSIELQHAGWTDSGRHGNTLTKTDLSKVDRIASMIAQRYTETLTAEAIGKFVDLHPNYAMGLFKKTFGITLIDYITKLRVSHAQRLLATTDAKVLDIALASGFSSNSRFNAAFVLECGCSPSIYRQQQQLPRPKPH
jgi:AraC-like DNA-binding protein